MTTFEVAMREACGIGSKPILIYATDKAMDETPEPLPDALKTFVRFDNRHFKQELSQAEQEQPTPLLEMSYISTLRAAGVHLKKKRSTDSMDSMATNQASAGDLDDLDMRDAPSLDAVFANDGVMDQDQNIQELVDISVADGSISEHHRSLQQARDTTPQEMQERGNVPLLTRPVSGLLAGMDGVSNDIGKS